MTHQYPRLTAVQRRTIRLLEQHAADPRVYLTPWIGGHGSIRIGNNVYKIKRHTAEAIRQWLKQVVVSDPTAIYAAFGYVHVNSPLPDADDERRAEGRRRADEHNAHDIKLRNAYKGSQLAMRIALRVHDKHFDHVTYTANAIDEIIKANPVEASQDSELVSCGYPFAAKMLREAADPCLMLMGFKNIIEDKVRRHCGQAPDHYELRGTVVVPKVPA